MLSIIFCNLTLKLCIVNIFPREQHLHNIDEGVAQRCDALGSPRAYKVPIYGKQVGIIEYLHLISEMNEATFSPVDQP